MAYNKCNNKHQIMSEEPKTYTPTEAAAILKVDRRMIYQYIELGILRPLPLQKRHKKIPASQIEDLLNRK